MLEHLQVTRHLIYQSCKEQLHAILCLKESTKFNVKQYILDVILVSRVNNVLELLSPEDKCCSVPSSIEDSEI